MIIDQNWLIGNNSLLQKGAILPAFSLDYQNVLYHLILTQNKLLIIDAKYLFKTLEMTQKNLLDRSFRFAFTWYRGYVQIYWHNACVDFIPGSFMIHTWRPSQLAKINDF